MVPLADVLEEEYGVDLQGWHLMQARAISDDGLVMAGSGWNSLGEEDTWVVRLPITVEVALGVVAEVPATGMLARSLIGIWVLLAGVRRLRSGAEEVGGGS